MAYTQTDLDAIRAAIQKGHKRVALSDRVVVYRDLDEMRAIEGDILDDLQNTNGLRKPRQFRVITSKGL